MSGLLICSFIFFFTLINPSYAYFDPGTGSIILHAILAFFAFGLSWVIGKYHQIKNFFLKKKNTTKKNLK
jgi:hypothetical protein